MNDMFNSTKTWVPTPGALGSGKKVKYHLISIPKSISKIFKSNFVCPFTNERYITYQTEFLFHFLGHASGLGLLGTERGGGQKLYFPKFNQI